MGLSFPRLLRNDAAAWRIRGVRQFSLSLPRQEIRDIETLPPRIYPRYKGIT
jgi:hypothetical protein